MPDQNILTFGLLFKLNYLKTIVLEKSISGIHHISAIADDPQKNINFYSGILGLRFIKKTVNFDDPEAYHFYYGNETGEPGTVLTFFAYPGMKRGRRGNGMINTIAFSASSGAFNFWVQRLNTFGILHEESEDVFGNGKILKFNDFDGLALEIVFNEKDERTAFTYGNIPSGFSLRGFFNAEIWGDNFEETSKILTQYMDHILISKNGNRYRFGALDKPGHYVDFVDSPRVAYASGGSGTVHHMAFITKDENTQKDARNKILQAKLVPTGIINRNYFKSVYFREPGGVLFEIATSGPGFMIDEDLNDLGTHLKLPSQYESRRDSIEKSLRHVDLNLNDYK